ncbi:hypothetical protein QQS21_007821 [Conoideocrella luteorostrata]|uniref:Metallo-beta-lactamase domain-containing protein n=1 Tax=Conoideocrella luteorostrata TaxID=1105319 RepID=A0AAJ0CK61_9HYPO|nr:hypothetical protein QQS21_007821 [Conoideocrella luteorostrata]
MPRQVEVLGSQAAYPTLQQPCSGFLLTWDDWTAVLDLGYGTLQGLLVRIPDGRVNAIVITHDHPDHWLDLHALFRLLLYGPQDNTKAKIALYCTFGVVNKMRFLEPDVTLEDVFDISIMEDRREFRTGQFQLIGFLLPHRVPNIGVRLSVLQRNATYEPILAYTGDTGPTPTLEELGKGVRVYIMDSTDWQGEESKAVEERKLLQSEEAGTFASAAGARMLLLTHFRPGNDREKSRELAKRSFGEDVLIAEPGLVVQLDLM